ncbi:MAG: AraC family transcriptional regulator [Gammaproteobacteria bacterium]|nr:AraC family transcriptional regulator [Gammaproteobacteria bacterium]
MPFPLIPSPNGDALAPYLRRRPNVALPAGCGFVLPDAGATLVFRTGGQREPMLALIGPKSRLRTLPRLDGASASVQFKSGGAGRFFRNSMDTMTDTKVALDELWGTEASVLLDRLMSARTPADATALLHGALLQRMSRSQPSTIDRKIDWAVSRLARLDDQGTVAELARSVGLSDRHFRRTFTARVGLSPQQFGAVCRFRSAVNQAMRASDETWATIAAATGYTDQSHMSRAFVRMTGSPPGQLLRAIQTGA